MPGGVPPSVVRERERVAWDLRKRFWTEARIADHLGITQPAVHQILKRVEARVLADLKADVEATKARQTAQLERVAEEAFSAWEHSCTLAETVKTVTQTESGESEPAVRDEKTTQSHKCDANLLNQARGALEDIRKIWGLDAPVKVDVQSEVKLYAFDPDGPEGP